MSKQRSRRASGSVRKLPSGKFQARVLSPLSNQHVSLGTFPTKADANAAVAKAETEQSSGGWIDPRHGKVAFGTYADDWLEKRVRLSPRTYELYEGLLRNHIKPTFERTPLAKLSAIAVRDWNASLVNAGKPGSLVPAKAYRLLRTILNTAVNDDIIAKNPCRVEGAGVERSKERSVATIEQVFLIASLIAPEYKAMVLLGTFCSLRFGELRALKRMRLSPMHGTVAIVESVQEMRNGSFVFGPPKTDAGRRTVTMPEAIRSDVEAHLKAYVGAGRDALLFTSGRGNPLRRMTFYKEWNRATAEAGVPGLHFHDLRHTGNTLAAQTGASTKDLMARMGHASARAALIYQHASVDQERLIATALSQRVENAFLKSTISSDQAGHC